MGRVLFFFFSKQKTHTRLSRGPGAPGFGIGNRSRIKGFRIKGFGIRGSGTKGSRNQGSRNQGSRNQGSRNQGIWQWGSRERGGWE